VNVSSLSGTAEEVAKLLGVPWDLLGKKPSEMVDLFEDHPFDCIRVRNRNEVDLFSPTTDQCDWIDLREFLCDET
jgi:hypothetical protein